MRILLTGSHGLVGSALTAHLESEGHTVVPLVSAARGRARGPGGPGQRTQGSWDPEVGLIDAEAVNGCDAAVNLAGEPLGERRWTPEIRRRIVDSRVKGTALLAQTLADSSNPPTVLVNASAVGYYGDRGDEVLTEESPPGHGFLAGLCQQWEAATAPAEQRGIRVVLLRTGLVLSRKGGSLAKQLPLFRLGLGGRLGSGRQYQSWISLADEVGAISTAIHRETLNGPINVTSPEPVTNLEFTRVLARCLHRPALLPAPSFGIALVLGAEMARETALASQRAIPTKLASAGYQHQHPTLVSALEAALTE